MAWRRVRVTVHRGGHAGAGMLRRPAARAVVAVATGAVLVAGCGGSGGAAGPTGSPPGASVGVSTPAATGAGSSAPARSTPTSLRIPAIGVDTPVISLGLAADGTVQVPPIEAHAPAGWYDQSPTPGQVGPSVILGHVTVGAYGDGVFLHLGRLKAGDRITVGLADGQAPVFTVDSVQTVPKTTFPTQAVYGNTDRPALRLITCGGPRGADGYADNVIVYASLTSG